jgi:class 3 adenylate cyclase
VAPIRWRTLGFVMAVVHAEYKQVTVLFADVVHSMDIATAVGAERLREIMAELVSRATLVVVQHFGGTLDKFTSDRIMVVFRRARRVGGPRRLGLLGGLGRSRRNLAAS